MPLLGREGTEAIQIQLTPKLLVRLVRDLLASRGHSSIRQTDGPGDGGRDVHSIAEDGEKHLAQCKHHENHNFACSSSEVAELPMALVKLGYQRGLFVTDARISPQAKREYLNDYPHLKLEFLDLEELVAEVLSRSVLKAIWFDGGRLAAVNSRVTFPLIVRLHNGDSPIIPLRHANLREAIPEIVRALAANIGEFEIEVREAPSSREPFERYRYPARLTMEEGARSELTVTEFGFKGALALHELDELARSLGAAVAKEVSQKRGAATVVVGCPFITPLDGEQAGMRTLTEGDRHAFVGVNGDSMAEEEWFMPEEPPEWDTTSDARVSESNWVRFYSGRLNAAVAYEVETPPAPIHTVVRQIGHYGWMKSVFALLPSWGSWPYDDLAEPDEQAPWPYESGRTICGWYHAYTSGVPVRVPSDSGDEASAFESVNEEEEARRLSSIRARLQAVAEVQFLDPERARHMVALISQDPFAGERPTIFRTADLVVAFDGLASPIDPGARRVEIIMAWRVAQEDEETITDAATRLAKALGGAAELEREQELWVLTLNVSCLPLNTSTRAWFRDLGGHIERYFLPIEVEIQNRGRSLGLATAEYWYRAHDVRLGVPWHASAGREYMWKIDDDGISPVQVSREDIEGKN